MAISAERCVLDRSHLPLLGAEEAPDLGFLLRVNHGAARGRRIGRPRVGSLANVRVRTHVAGRAQNEQRNGCDDVSCEILVARAASTVT